MDRSQHGPRVTLVALALLMALAGCGGSDDEPTPGHRRGKPMRNADVVATKPVVQTPPTSSPKRTDQPQAPTAQPAHPVKGTLETVRGVRVLRVWGSPAEMGYAHGYLLASDLLQTLENHLVPAIEADGCVWNDEPVLRSIRESILWPEGYSAELDAMARGMDDALGASPTLQMHPDKGPVRVDAEMLMVLNAVDGLGALAPAPGGSCAAVWGERTDDGHLFCFGTKQNPCDALNKRGMLIVRRPDHGLASVCATHVGMVSGAQGMNAEGVVVVSQATEIVWQAGDSPGYAGIHTRLVLETVGASDDMVDAAKRVIESHPVCGSSILMIAQDASDATPLADDEVAAVIECDQNGVTARRSSMNGLGLDSHEALVATNHHLSHGNPRAKPAHTDSPQRYRAMAEAIMGNTIVHLSDMQRVAQAGDPVGCAETTVYFEPGARLVHVALRTDSSMPPAPHIKPATFTWNELMAPLEAEPIQP